MNHSTSSLVALVTTIFETLPPRWGVALPRTRLVVHHVLLLTRGILEIEIGSKKRTRKYPFFLIDLPDLDEAGRTHVFPGIASRYMVDGYVVTAIIFVEAGAR